MKQNDANLQAFIVNFEECAAKFRQGVKYLLEFLYFATSFVQNSHNHAKENGTVLKKIVC